MKLALVLFSLAALNSFPVHAQITDYTRCGEAISKVSQPSTLDLWRGLTKNSHDLYAVTNTLHENGELIEEAAQAGKSFDVVRRAAAKNGFPFGSQNLPYYEREYLKVYIAKNCADVALEAGASSPYDPVAYQRRVSDPNADFDINRVGDATRGLNPVTDTTTPSEGNR